MPGREALVTGAEVSSNLASKAPPAMGGNTGATLQENSLPRMNQIP